MVLFSCLNKMVTKEKYSRETRTLLRQHPVIGWVQSGNPLLDVQVVAEDLRVRRVPHGLPQLRPLPLTDLPPMVTNAWAGFGSVDDCTHWPIMVTFPVASHLGKKINKNK